MEVLNGGAGLLHIEENRAEAACDGRYGRRERAGGRDEFEIDAVIVEHGEGVGRRKRREQAGRGRVDVREAVVADAVDGAEEDALSLEAVERNAHGMGGDHDRAVGAGGGVGAVGLDAVPVDDAEAAGLRSRRRVFHAADRCLETGFGLGGAGGIAGVAPSGDAGAHGLHRIAGR